ncbi:hypothetical protein IM792_19230 [Mucilaginibacter sp. JRF]|uniref:CBU_0592 family membrane protein n=1 Tax=Mucilaginibacter sp. JRF TaxID=2780088 RepID=UPI0018830CCC|nr:hypothetical protein [Mucilaginibacter sp. JRF]MBE9586590.1 hypothetical protein [Mucilaginibacter sp. JRF]
MHQATTKIVFDVLGWLGALLFLVSYFLLIIKKWRPTSVAFHLANILGGLFVGASALYDHSYPAAFLNFVWGAIAIYGMYTDNLRKG